MSNSSLPSLPNTPRRLSLWRPAFLTPITFKFQRRVATRHTYPQPSQNPIQLFQFSACSEDTPCYSVISLWCNTLILPANITIACYLSPRLGRLNRGRPVFTLAVSHNDLDLLSCNDKTWLHFDEHTYIHMYSRR